MTRSAKKLRSVWFIVADWTGFGSKTALIRIGRNPIFALLFRAIDDDCRTVVAGRSYVRESVDNVPDRCHDPLRRPAVMHEKKDQ